jgi:hypothetical protein
MPYLLTIRLIGGHTVPIETCTVAHGEEAMVLYDTRAEADAAVRDVHESLAAAGMEADEFLIEEYDPTRHDPLWRASRT